MRVLRDILPVLTLAILTLVSVLPWGLPSESRFILPLLPALGMHYWIMRGAEFPEWLAFANGLAVDVLTSGPLGFWSLIYLIGYALSSLASRHAGMSMLARWLVVLAVLAGLCMAAWLTSSLFYFEVADWQPFAWAALVATAGYPLLALVLGVFSPREVPETRTMFERGG
jgi:rod shape-determining protein MreD